MRWAALKSPKGLLAGTQSSCGPANTAGPVSREAYDVRPRKVRRACSQGRNRGAAPQTPQCLLSGKHTTKHAARESTNGLFSNKFERHFAARTPSAAQTPICCRTPVCSPKPVCSPNANLQAEPKRQFAADCQFAARTRISSPNACIPAQVVFLLMLC